MSKNEGIRISPKHGANPTCVMCFWCGKVKEVALFGMLEDDAKAPDKVFLDYEPCSECEKSHKRGILVFEVDPSSDNPLMHPDDQGGAPTGRHLIMKVEGLPIFFDIPQSDLDKIAEIGAVAVSRGAFEKLRSYKL